MSPRSKLAVDATDVTTWANAWRQYELMEQEWLHAMWSCRIHGTTQAAELPGYHDRMMSARNQLDRMARDVLDPAQEPA